jgi:hypothetical protein
MLVLYKERDYIYTSAPHFKDQTSTLEILLAESERDAPSAG